MHAFFIPSQLIAYEYFEPKQTSAKLRKLAEPYRDDIDFAFFAVNFGYTKRDYEELTERDKVFIYKAYENKTVSWTTLLRDAVLNAVSNALRKKSKRFMKLWHKRTGKADPAIVAQNLKIVREIEEKEAGWIDKIYEANGRKKPQRKVTRIG